MKTLALDEGDLVVGSLGHETVSGSPKIRQDLANALGEEWDTDRFHRGQWGSTVMNYLGLPLDEEIEFEVRSEVSRVLGRYIDIQAAEVLDDVYGGRRSRFETADVVRKVSRIDTRADFDAIRISLSLVTGASNQVTVDRTMVL